MKTELFSIKESSEKKKVKIEDDGFGLYLFIMRNGHQWTGSSVDDELLSMIRSAIDDYFEIIDSGECDDFNLSHATDCTCFVCRKRANPRGFIIDGEDMIYIYASDD